MEKVDLGRADWESLCDQLLTIDHVLTDAFNDNYQHDGELYNISITMYIVYNQIFKEIPRGYSTTLLNYK